MNETLVILLVMISSLSILTTSGLSILYDVWPWDLPEAISREQADQAARNQWCAEKAREAADNQDWENAIWWGDTWNCVKAWEARGGSRGE